MDSESFRRWLARQLKVDAVPPPLWDEAEKNEWPEEVYTGELDPEDALGFIRERMDFFRRMRDWEQGRTPADRGGEDEVSYETVKLPLGNSESRRAEALEEYIAKVAASERSVHEFRKRFLGGGVLPPEQARALISSPAAAYLPFHYFLPSGKVQVPMVGHDATHEMRPKERDERDLYTPVDVTVTPPGARLTVHISRWERLIVPGENGRPQSITIGSDSVLNRLRELSARLPRSYPWEEHQVSWFILTGETPEVPAAKGRYHASRSSAATFGTITLTIQPWVPAETVRKFYRGLQLRVVPSDSRALSERNLAVFRFVLSQRQVRIPDRSARNALHRAKPKKPELVQPFSWRALLERWNKEHPEGHEWHYKGVQNFWRDFKRAEQAVVHPPYKTQA
jgi:hypothetical protein